MDRQDVIENPDPDDAEKSAAASALSQRTVRSSAKTGTVSRSAAKSAVKAINARAALAQPEPEELTDEELKQTVRKALENYKYETEIPYFLDGTEEEPMMIALRAVASLTRPAIKPVPVAERPWEREGWCDAEGFAWFWSPEDQCWFWERPCSNFIKRYGSEFSCLPHWALPLPTSQEATDA